MIEDPLRLRVKWLGLALTLMIGGPGSSLMASEDAHPIHLSTAEVELNLETQRLEVALQVFPEDLDEALSLRAQKPIRIDQTEGVNDLIVAYLQDCLWVGDERSNALVWIGKQVTFRETWLYFEIPIEGEFQADSIQNRIFFELFDDQVNHIAVSRKWGPPLRYATVESIPEPGQLGATTWWKNLSSIGFLILEKAETEALFDQITQARDQAASDLEKSQEDEEPSRKPTSPADLQTYQFLQDHLATLRQANDALGVSRCLLSLARFSVQLGKETAALRYAQEAMPLIKQQGGAFERCQALEAAALLASGRGEWAQVVGWLGASERIRIEEEIDLNQAESEEQERLLGRGRDRLGREEFAKRWGRGFRGKWERMSEEVSTYLKSILESP